MSSSSWRLRSDKAENTLLSIAYSIPIGFFWLFKVRSPTCKLSQNLGTIVDGFPSVKTPRLTRFICGVNTSISNLKSQIE
ncbi:MAG TPA: hypothetical protein V6D28_23675 [Leptolyngbyaceae cyanobacterium]